jgi:phytoene/squalene synthetase
VEEYLQNQWARSCALGRGDLRELDARRDQVEIARLLDQALPRARRQLGAIQVHTWVFIAALDAIEEGLALEFSVAYSMLDAMRQDQRYSTYLRQSGQQNYLGRTASLINGTMEEYVRRYPLSI